MLEASNDLVKDQLQYIFPAFKVVSLCHPWMDDTRETHFSPPPLCSHFFKCGVTFLLAWIFGGGDMFAKYKVSFK